MDGSIPLRLGIRAQLLLGESVATASSARARRALALVLAPFAALSLVPASAQAAASGCTSSAATSIEAFFSDLSLFAIGIGGGGALLMVALGSVLIIFGHTPKRASQGMDWIKNAAKGLVLLAAGLFLKFIVLDLVIGAAGTNGPSSSAIACLKTGGGNI